MGKIDSNLDSTWIVVPAYNEGERIDNVLSGVKAHSNNIVVVDDGSLDNTLEVSKLHTPHALRHIVNLGKGAALKTGCDFAIHNGARNIIVIDADGQHNSSLIPKFAEELNNGSEIVFGYRELGGNMPFVLRFGNWVINKTTSTLYGMNLKDTQCGYRGFTSGAYNKIRWGSSDYCMESEMIKNAGKNNLKYSQVPIDTIYADKYKGTTVLDGVKIVLRMFLWRLTEWR